MSRRSNRGRFSGPINLLFDPANGAPPAALTKPFASFAAAWRHLGAYGKALPAVRVQGDGACVHFAAWTAIELFVGPIPRPDFFKGKMDAAKGVIMRDMYVTAPPLLLLLLLLLLLVRPHADATCYYTCPATPPPYHYYC